MPTVLVATASDVAALLPMEECMSVMEDALRTMARGGAVLPLRSVLRLPDGRSSFLVMPAVLEAPGALGVKALTLFPGNEGTRHESHQGVVVLFETEHGSPIAILDAAAITAIRTAAVSGVATRLLARPDAHDLAVLGAGVQARTHLEAMLAARAVARVRVWSRTPERARRFAESESRRHGVSVETVATAREAVEGADIICTTTGAQTPVLHGEWLAPGAHVNAVGASTPSARELDTAAVVRARLFVDRRESALNEAGEILIPKREGAIGDGHVKGELGDVLLGRVSGREFPEQVTLFKSLGLAVEDVAAGHHVYRKARATGAGAWIELGGRSDATG